MPSVMLNGKGVEAHNTHTAVPSKWDRCLWYKLEKWRRLISSCQMFVTRGWNGHK